MHALIIEAIMSSRALVSRTARRGSLPMLCCVLLGRAPWVSAQMVPAGFAATVRVDTAYFRGDTLFVTHVASNASSSPAPLWGVVLESPTRGAVQRRPATGHWLLNRAVFDGRPSAQWIALGAAKSLPGASTPPLTLGAVGIPDIVSYWVIAFAPPKQVDDPDAEDAVNPMVQRAIRGASVGIVPVPPGATTASLTVRLRALLARSCTDLGWITQAGVCHSLDVKLRQAQDAVAAQQGEMARAALTAFANELDAQHGPQPGKHVNASAYALLSLNAAYLLARP